MNFCRYHTKGDLAVFSAGDNFTGTRGFSLPLSSSRQVTRRVNWRTTVPVMWQGRTSRSQVRQEQVHVACRGAAVAIPPSRDTCLPGYLPEAGTACMYVYSQLRAGLDLLDAPFHPWLVQQVGRWARSYSSRGTRRPSIDTSQVGGTCPSSNVPGYMYGILVRQCQCRGTRLAAPSPNALSLPSNIAAANFSPT